MRHGCPAEVIMNRKISLVLCVLVAAYASAYLFYRIGNRDAVLDYVGGHVLRPSWLASPDGDASDFTFDAHSRQFGPAVIGESFAGPSVVTRMADVTGWDCAEFANTIFYSAARIDYLFSGRYIRFTRSSAPVFFTRGAAQTIDLNLELDAGKFSEFSFARPSP
jgi:hypothetical protein